MKVKEHLRSADEFYEIGMKEYEEGKRGGDLTRMREGCEKVFHAYVEASTALIQKSGLPEPESHADRYESLYKLNEKRMIDVGKDAFFFLHKFAYYDGRIFPDVEKTLKDVDETIRYVREKL
ncbi:MAG: hypothetical protein QW270_06920 [Candidatus Bathyarchaeia archaeon]